MKPRRWNSTSNWRMSSTSGGKTGLKKRRSFKRYVWSNCSLSWRLAFGYLTFSIFIFQLKELQAKRKEIRAQQEKELAEQKREEEERIRREEADKKAKEAEEKRRRLEEAEKKRQTMVQSQREKMDGYGSYDKGKMLGVYYILSFFCLKNNDDIYTL